MSRSDSVWDGFFTKQVFEKKDDNTFHKTWEVYLDGRLLGTASSQAAAEKLFLEKTDRAKFRFERRF